MPVRTNVRFAESPNTPRPNRQRAGRDDTDVITTPAEVAGLEASAGMRAVHSCPEKIPFDVVASLLRRLPSQPNTLAEAGIVRHITLSNPQVPIRRVHRVPSIAQSDCSCHPYYRCDFLIMHWLVLSVVFPIAAAAMAMRDDSELVARLKRRDPDAMAILYDRYGRIMYSLILRVVRNEAVAEDLVQESFLRVWNRVHGFDQERGALAPWILAMARNRAIDYVRSVQGRATGIAARVGDG